MVVAVLLGLVLSLTAFARPTLADSHSTDNQGTDFWVTFMPNGPPIFSLYLSITGDTATTGTVSVPGLGFSAPFEVIPGVATTVEVPLAAQLTYESDVVENLGVHVTAAEEIVVHPVSQRSFSHGAYLGLPTDVLGTEYLVLGWGNDGGSDSSQLAVVATQDDTIVTITPSVTTSGHTAGVPYDVALDQGQTYKLNNSDEPSDLTGTIVSSDKPVAVFGGARLASIPGPTEFLDHVVEQMPPAGTWGTDFLTVPLALRTGGDFFRILASTDATTVKIDGVTVAVLDRGEFHQQLITGPSHITTDQPALVAQYATGLEFDNTTGDPLEMLITPTQQFLSSYTVTTLPAADFPGDNFVNIVVPDAAIGAVTLDGVVVPADSYTPIGTSGYSSAQVPVSSGSAYHLAGPLPFGAFVYGFHEANGYGYPAGMSLAAIAAPPTCNGQVATIVGTAGPDKLFGTAGVDVIVGLGGNDSIYGYGANDVICAGAGNDIVYGGAGDDFIDGEAGDDRVMGDADNDDLRGGEGSDRVFGGAGNDAVAGGPATDYCYGGTGTNAFVTCEVFPAGTG